MSFLNPFLTLNPANFATAFAELDQLLTHYQAIWRPSPFTEENLLWQKDFPELHQALLALDEPQLLADETLLLGWMADFLPELKKTGAWQIKPFAGQLIDMPRFADVGIPGRKKQQIVGFASALFFEPAFKQACKPESAPAPVQAPANDMILDWCSGKGFLARQLHYVSKQPIHCLEFDSQLCDAGEKLAAQQGDDIHFIRQDVLQAIEPAWVNGASLHTALHACGDLHTTMMQTAAMAQSPHIALSPCCYHLTGHQHYQKLSQAARQSPLQLSKNDLRLAVLQTVTGGNRVKRLREQELVWRIGYDLLRRQITGIEQYQPTPSINKKWLSGCFVDYCRFVAETEKLPLPTTFDEQVLLAKAGHKYQRISRLEKARLAFRRALEYWLLLDRVLYLQDEGYQVDLTLFCEAKVSPRNALIQGRRVRDTHPQN